MTRITGDQRRHRRTHQPRDAIRRGKQLCRQRNEVGIMFGRIEAWHASTRRYRAVPATSQ